MVQNTAVTGGIMVATIEFPSLSIRHPLNECLKSLHELFLIIILIYHELRVITFPSRETRDKVKAFPCNTML